METNLECSWHMNGDQDPGENIFHPLDDGYALMDKIMVTNYLYTPGGMGEEAVNLCDITVINSTRTIELFSLAQNYPNPFNPSTDILFSIPEQSPVTLKIYDLLGKEVVTLINEVKAAGRYRVTFNAKELVSSVYIYELKAGQFSEKKKMTLIK